jgi:hypothetical protein
MSGWALRDENSPVRTLVGTLTRVHNSGDSILLSQDGDTNLTIVPNAASAALLRNRNEVDNRDGTIECEVNVTEDGNGRSSYESWASSMIGTEVTAKGIYVDDTGHDDKTEIHPMDLILARVSSSAMPGDWIGDVARQHGIQVDLGLFAYRYAAASDDRGAGLFGDGIPPLARQTRATSVNLPFPPRPAGAIGPQVEVRSAGARNAASHINTTVTGDTVSAELVVTVKAVDDGGPGFDLAEVALYWLGPRVLDVSPASLSFGLIGIGEASVRSFTISNVGSEPVTVTVPGSPFPSSFGWMGVPATVLPPGGSLPPLTVEFSPLAAGTASGTVSVNSDAQGSPHVVSLSGRGRGGIPQ